VTYIVKPKFHHPALPKNALGYTHRDYEGSISTLCAGCGHDSISGAIIEACFALDIPPHRVAKLSGIGCSSKTPTYFLGNSHGFQLGAWAHALGADRREPGQPRPDLSRRLRRRRLSLHRIRPIRPRAATRREPDYIVENNGVYGLTKGQFSATADRGSKSKKGLANSDNAIDLAAIALQLGATFVARSFSGDKEQLVPLIKAALEHQARPSSMLSRLALPSTITPARPELRLRARAQRGGQPARLHDRAGADHGGL